MEKLKRVSLLATFGHLVTSQTTPYDLQRKFTASKRRMNTLDPRAPEAKRLEPKIIKKIITKIGIIVLEPQPLIFILNFYDTVKFAIIFCENKVNIC